MSMEAETVAAAETAEAAGSQVPTPKVAGRPVPTRPPTPQQKESLKESLQKLVSATFTVALATGVTNVLQIVLATIPSSPRRSRETVKGADECELGDPLFSIT